MVSKGKGIASASTPSRTCTTKNSNRGRDEGFPTDRFDSQIHYNRWKTMEHRGITHERIIRFPDGEPDFLHEHVEGLGWGFMYNAFPPINVTMVREFCSNFSAAHQTHVFLRGRRIPLSEDDICHFLGINIDLPPLGEDDMYKKMVEARKNGWLDLNLVYQVIGRPGNNWANNPADHTIPEIKIDNAILNAQATAWHKLIIANIDPKQHGTTFDMNHAILIYVLMIDEVVNLPRIMRDVLLKRPTGNSRNLLPYPIYIARLTSRYQVPEFPRDEIYNVREQDMYYPYGDWKGEQPKAWHSEQHPPSPLPQPAKIPSSSVRHSPEPSLREAMRYLHRQERLQLNMQPMLRDAFPNTTFSHLLPVTSSEDDSNVES
ncbi:hypothetical protein PIB30_056780 [Stylosanthes scabra]|uniref:Putative plant transposon protein domain-containing protein n=1 Tax=Stylosanthes scabra TaxID=79078 RepID=A0ABU6XKG4_9FABA|nr:hypothetical protein [Stylosanthes scabra]